MDDEFNKDTVLELEEGDLEDDDLAVATDDEDEDDDLADDFKDVDEM